MICKQCRDELERERWLATLEWLRPRLRPEAALPG
jgi:hypothetical protein